ncbi:1-carboxy-3-chloro-3,4-dihydroxycyclo hexa-1,5-diene dehydrogenase [Chitinimonas prasina]|uniref:1-carboxy-3-chloro-3,4-dihydroxycyclo hexa-1,5-diene dehydrogenase n=1 Tax=Chitinimonas prasina TaxID=1434937 RepID=A0ABQ5YEM8_9NEIS|nr:Gfo/Idh/MocA family oxidoreductase [Chitinimonas prasina]GLR12922.1 1-carboxy-3-chloro-3,4-dihydroxycyclo hexa-1,5-diene dehydrogenase [Chitinimonas prasina]
MILSAAVIGCGRIGTGFVGLSSRVGVANHAAAYARHPGVSLLAVADPVEAAREQAAQAYGATAHADHVSMLLQCQPALVSIASPDATHAAVLRDVLQCASVRGVLVEKPLALSADEAAALLALAGERGVALAVNYSRRYSHRLQHIAARLRGGEWGKVLSLQGHYTKGITHNGSHWLDWARLLAGEIVTVRAVDCGMPAYEHDPSPSVQLGFACGATGWLQALSHHDYASFELEVFTDQARLRFSESGQVFESWRAGESPDYPGYRQLLPQGRQDDLLKDVLLHAVTDLVEAVQQGRPALCQGGDGLTALRLAEAAIASLQQGGIEVRLG